ncbi:hypothetical protein CesoFtcFv8_007479 [Champsocephalus esox]|uniref:Uncharacterized protein n=2 Tax=Champsocephalus TaxID=52236 RepID=A0AAN8H4K0_9TELE|nr:hypothetical protein CesoFtcFv8_007479 [Champsocephalus esox]
MRMPTPASEPSASSPQGGSQVLGTLSQLCHNSPACCDQPPVPTVDHHVLSFPPRDSLLTQGHAVLNIDLQQTKDGFRVLR